MLGYWDIRGLAQNIRLQLAYHGINFENKMYPTTEDVSSRDVWFNGDKFNLGLDFPNLPYFIDTDGHKMTETFAIHEYLADKYAPDLNGRTPEERAKVLMLKGVLWDIKKAVTGPMYSGEKTAEEIVAMAVEKLQSIVTYMGENSFLMGDYVTYIDFFFYEFVQ